MELHNDYLVNRTISLILILSSTLLFSACVDDDKGGGICIEGVGLSHPSPTCSTDDVCTDLVPTYAMFDPPIAHIDTASDEPSCGTSQRGLSFGRPSYNDGAARQWKDADGIIRYWCEVRPMGTSIASPRPLVIWVTGSGGNASTLYDATSLRGKQQTFDISGDPARPGFILVSIQPRNLHWPTVDRQDGTKSEIYYRDFYSPSTNPDIAFVDQIVDSLVAEGVVDRARIYMMGWSNGARFSALYSIARHEQATPSGNYVAAVANFSGGNPYASFDDAMPACALSELPSSSIPFFMISRRCDAVACDEKTDLKIVPGNVVEPWIKSLRDEIGAEVTWMRIDALGNLSSSCSSAALCMKSEALIGHFRWPDGIDDMGGQDHEPAMLQFLADHDIRPN